MRCSLEASPPYLAIYIHVYISLSVSISDRVACIRNHQCGTYETPNLFVKFGTNIFINILWPFAKRFSEYDVFHKTPHKYIYRLSYGVLVMEYGNIPMNNYIPGKCINIFVGFLIVIEKHLPHRVAEKDGAKFNFD